MIKYHWPLLIVGLVFVAACEPRIDNSKTIESSNPAMLSKYEGEVDGCKIYWVQPYDGNPFNFVRCPADMTMTDERHRAGKISHETQTYTIIEPSENYQKN